MEQIKTNQIFRKYSMLPVQDWRRDLVRSVVDTNISGLDFPTFPSADLQRHLQGSSNELSIRGALAFREFCVNTCELNQVPLGANSSLCDFGTGWGRIARAFMRDLPATNIYAIEPFDFIIEARKCNSYINFIQTEPLPQTCLKDGFLTHLVTWSTFTHFNEEFFRAWVAEFSRIVRPGGLLFISLLGRHFLNKLRDEWRRMKSGEEIQFWIKLILNRVDESSLGEMISAATAGEFVWLPSEQAARAEFAECFVTDAYFTKNFNKLFEIVHYAANGELAQDCIVLRRR